MLGVTRMFITVLLMSGWSFMNAPLLAGDQLHTGHPTFQTIVEIETTGRLLETLLACGRNAINEHQHLFDHSDQGNKEFTPGVFEHQLKDSSLLNMLKKLVS